MKLRRRSFLQLIGVSGAAAVTGCTSESARVLIPYIIPPEDIVPMEATWFATTCRECPAGCGMLAKNVDKRIIKVEGNPTNGLNNGKLCPRGQASLHGLYNPDRFPGPLLRDSAGNFATVTWEEARTALTKKIEELRSAASGKRIVFLTDHQTSSFEDLVGYWLTQNGDGEHVAYEPFAYESLRTANTITFGRDAIPTYDIDRADFLISFGAGFLETWVSNIEYTEKFARFHELRDGRKNPFVFVGPRYSLTAANSDDWVAVSPGSEHFVALGMLAFIREKHADKLDSATRDALQGYLGTFSANDVLQKAGLEPARIEKLTEAFMAAKAPLALAEGLPFTSPASLDTAVAANLLCMVKPESRALIDFGREYTLSGTATADEMKELTESMRKGEVGMLLVAGVNPAFTLPDSWKFSEALASVPYVVSFSPCRDETTAHAHLILPGTTPLESWGDYSPKQGAIGFMQPVMGNVFDSKHPGDILINTGAELHGSEKFPWDDFYSFLNQSWHKKWQDAKSDQPFELFWANLLRNGGLTTDVQAVRPSLKSNGPSGHSFNLSAGASASSDNLHLSVYPTIQFFDGRIANRFWIQELPDPITQTTWGAWVEMHPDTAEKRNIKRGDLLRVTSPHGSVDLPAMLLRIVALDTVAIPIGQGHTDYGRYASGLPANPFRLLPPAPDAGNHGIGSVKGVTVQKTEGSFPIAHTDGSLYQYNRRIVQTETLQGYTELKNNNHKPDVDYPLPSGVDPKKDFYAPHVHPDYRWCMVVDLDRCIGCGACVVACYAENNLSLVGREQVLLGREMSWLRVQRYFDEDSHVARFLPMLCQHCDYAPCESVCPIFAPQHSVEGLNNQVYNRCFGTRFCSQNDPYKVRRFNWFTFSRPQSLKLQLNPAVTVRQKGVMEKCSFCIQRIVQAKIDAKVKGRKVQDGDFTTACAQTCPTNALIFGNLKDPNSRVSRLIDDPRAYQVFRDLNTKPAVIYLKKITREI